MRAFAGLFAALDETTKTTAKAKPTPKAPDGGKRSLVPQLPRKS